MFKTVYYHHRQWHAPFRSIAIYHDSSPIVRGAISREFFSVQNQKPPSGIPRQSTVATSTSLLIEFAYSVWKNMIHSGSTRSETAVLYVSSVVTDDP